MVKNIVFDMGNVLVRYDSMKVCRHFMTDETEMEKVCTSVFISPEWLMLDMGLITEAAALKRMQKRLPDDHAKEMARLCLEDISSKVVPVVTKVTGDAEVQTQKVTGTNEVIIKTKTLSVDQRQALNDALVENFGVEEDKITAESISGAVSNEMKRDAIAAVIIATICMLIYIWFRFKDIRFATSAVLALLHDVLVVLTFYAAARWSVGSTFIACMLTIVGYSINATIVIFDRVRENLKVKTNKQSLADLVNLSITQTFTRSINTSLTTVVMVIVLFIMGVSSVREFALPLIVGIVCGTYSSVCITGALWYVMTTHKKEK